MMSCLIKSASVIRWGGRVAVVTLSVALVGCSPEGTGSIKIEDPQEVRAKFEAAPPPRSPRMRSKRRHSRPKRRPVRRIPNCVQREVVPASRAHFRRSAWFRGFGDHRTFFHRSNRGVHL